METKFQDDGQWSAGSSTECSEDQDFRYDGRQKQIETMKSVIRTIAPSSKFVSSSGVGLAASAQRSAALKRLDMSDPSVQSSPFPCNSTRTAWEFLNETFQDKGRTR